MEGRAIPVDYFAHGVYGVLADKQLHDKIEDLVRRQIEIQVKSAESLSDDEYDEDDWLSSNAREEALAELNLRPDKPPEWQAILKESGAPEGAWIHWTGDSDTRPGRCATESDRYAIGFGTVHFPAEIPPGSWLPAWHFWVEAG